MRKEASKKRPDFSFFIAGCIAMILSFIYLFFNSEEERLIRYPREDVRILCGDDLASLRTGGPLAEKEGFGVFSLKKGVCYSFALGKADGLCETGILTGELNCSGIPAILFCGRETDGIPVFLTKGWNSFRVQGKTGEMKLILIPRADSTVHVRKIAWIREGSRRRFPLNALAAAAAVFGIFAAGTRIRFVLTRRKKAGILCGWFLFYMMQLRNVWYCFDDYGYLSLTYRGMTNNRGTGYGLSEIARFLSLHYCRWGGRVTAFLAELLAGRNLTLLRIISCLILSGLSYEVLRLLHPRTGNACTLRSVKKQKLSTPEGCAGSPASEGGAMITITGGDALMPVLLWCFLDLTVLRDAAWWYTASVLYLWPVYGILLGTRLYRENTAEDLISNAASPSGRDGIFTSVREKGLYVLLRKQVSLAAAFFSASAQEQISAAALIITLFCFSEWLCCRIKSGKISEVFRGRGKVYAVLYVLAVAAGCVFLLAAPGNYVRLEMGGNSGAAQNALSLLRILLSDRLRFYILLFMTCAGCASLGLSGKGGKTALFHRAAGVLFLAVSAGLYALSCGLVSLCQAVRGICGLENFRDRSELISGILLFAAAVFIFRWILSFNPRMICLMAGAFASMLSALAAPGISARMLLPSALFLLPVSGSVLQNLICRGSLPVCKGNGDGPLFIKEKSAGIRKRTDRFWRAGILTGLMISAAVMNCDSMQEGYFRNSVSEEYNMAVLKDYENRKDDNNLVILKKHWDDEYGNFMPYMEGYKWIEEYMKAMYNLPEEAVFRWEKEEIYEDLEREKDKEYNTAAGGDDAVREQ